MFIEIKDAVKTYGEGEAKVYALNELSFSLDRGEVCVVLGASGSGKSTFLNMLGGLDRLNSGIITVNGENIGDYNQKQLTEYRREKIGFIFQSYNLMNDLTVKENIETAKNIAKRPLDMIEIMSYLGIERLAKRFPKELSGGQRQRVAIARALVKNPDVLLCDELTGALDSSSARDVISCVQEINRKYNTTTIMISHNELLAQVATKIVRIKDGKIVKETINENIKNAEEIAF
jgi:putative ABC transport system ATP-binding protein